MNTRRVGDCEIIGFPVFAWIYGIWDGDRYVYIGSTVMPILNRVRQHLHAAKGGQDHPLYHWIRDRHFKFDVHCLEVVDVLQRHQCEKNWIKNFKNQGVKLFNMTDGGAGASGIKWAGTERAKDMAAKLRRGKHFYCEKCGTKFWRKKAEIMKNHNKFCSRFCSNSRHKG